MDAGHDVGAEPDALLGVEQARAPEALHHHAGCLVYQDAHTRYPLAGSGDGLLGSLLHVGGNDEVQARISEDLTPLFHVRSF